MAAGFNDHDTPIKCENFRNLLHLQLIAADGVYQKHQWARQKPYLYVDCNAGPGLYDVEGLRNLATGKVLHGSPLIFLEEIKKFGLSFRAIFMEEDRAMFDRLLRNIASFAGCKFTTADNLNYSSDNNSIHLFHGSNMDFLEAIPIMAWRIGTVYHDPNEPPNFDLLRGLNQKLPHTDLIVNINANGKKRKDGLVKKVGGETVSLEEEIRNVGKQRRLITDTLTGKWQWLMMLATNAGKDTIREWKAKGLIDADSIQGRSVIERAAYTDKERAAMNGQLSFFNQPGPEMHPIELTPNT